MIALLQRVRSASVHVDGRVVGEIARGILALIGVEKGDRDAQADRLLERILGYRVFPDEQQKMNLSVRDINGGLLLVPQFTLAADTRKGMRPSFSSAALPEQGRQRFDYLFERAATSGLQVAGGIFGADMQVHLVNDGPVTFWLQVPPA
jgi:D-tyrosyl-tRNA(Tyr) deacylase